MYTVGITCARVCAYIRMRSLCLWSCGCKHRRHRRRRCRCRPWNLPKCAPPPTLLFKPQMLEISAQSTAGRRGWGLVDGVAGISSDDARQVRTTGDIGRLEGRDPAKNPFSLPNSRNRWKWEQAGSGWKSGCNSVMEQDLF